MIAHDTQRNLNEYRIDRGQWSRGRMLLVGLAAAGWLASIAACAVDTARFASSYLVAFTYFCTIALGAMFFVMVQHLTNAGWSVSVRRLMENMMATIPAAAILFIPIATMLHDLYEWTHADVVAGDALLSSKAAYLNPTFFLIRAGAYFLIWILWAMKLYRGSVAQDASGSAENTKANARWSAPGVLLTFITVTLASFDWIMSLDPHWYSTIFGIYVYSGGVLAFMAALILICLVLQNSGVMRSAITSEHYHDLGKWLFAFTIFWAYIAFSQYLLIWYANIPEETVWFRHRFEGSWIYVSAALLVGHFLIPFLVLLSRAAKRNMKVLGATAAFVLVMHYIDLYWLIMPVFQKHGVHFSWIDGAAMLAVGGTMAAVFWARMKTNAVAPVGDPRFEQSLEFENV